MKKTLNAKLAALCVALVLSGCAAVTKVASGDAVVGNRLALKLDTAWNQFEQGLGNNTPTWTVEGITVDALQFYVGIKDGQPITRLMDNDKSKKPLNFRADMQPADIVALYEALLTRDGSSFQLEKLEPASFLGGRASASSTRSTARSTTCRCAAWPMARCATASCS